MLVDLKRSPAHLPVIEGYGSLIVKQYCIVGILLVPIII